MNCKTENIVAIRIEAISVSTEVLLLSGTNIFEAIVFVCNIDNPKF
jgi:hypothetical protein